MNTGRLKINGFMRRKTFGGFQIALMMGNLDAMHVAHLV